METTILINLPNKKKILIIIEVEIKMYLWVIYFVAIFTTYKSHI